MPVRVHIPEVLRRASGGADEVTVNGPTLALALEDLFRAHPALRLRTVGRDGRVHPYLVVFRNGAELAREGLEGTPLADGDRIEIVGAAEGG